MYIFIDKVYSRKPALLLNNISLLVHFKKHIYLDIRYFVCVCIYSKGNSILEVDDEGGRMFLRVLIHLTMHDYPPLVSGALQLLFRHFSQRQEVLHTFKQVHTHTQN